MPKTKQKVKSNNERAMEALEKGSVALDRIANSFAALADGCVSFGNKLGELLEGAQPVVARVIARATEELDEMDAAQDLEGLGVPA